MIDAHAHLTDDRFAADLDAVLERAAAAGVTRILTCGEDVASSERAVALARRSPLVRAMVGVHPHRADGLDAAALRRIGELARDPVVVGIGEIGIDLSGRSAAPAAQERAFLAQAELAARLDLPVCVHVRDSGPLARGLIDRVGGLRGLVHCYSEGPDEVGEWVARGFAISVAGTVTYPRAEGLRSAVARIPEDRLLLETDAPSLAPQPQRGRRNEPAYVAATYAEVAGIRGVPVERLAAQAHDAARTLLGARWEPT